MTQWPDPKANVAREVLKVLCAERTMDMPMDKLYRKTGLGIDEVDEVVEEIAKTGLVDLNEGWVRMSRNAVLAALCIELKIGA